MRRSLWFIGVLLSGLLVFSNICFAEGPPSANQVRIWLTQLNQPSIPEHVKQQLTAKIFHNTDVYRRAVLNGHFPASDAHVDEFLRRKKLLIQDVIQETNNRYRSLTGQNIQGPIIPFDYNNILSDDDVILSSGKEGNRLEPLFNEALSDVVEQRSGLPFGAADRQRIDVNGLSWDMTQQGGMDNYFHPEKYINPQSGYANQSKLQGSKTLFVAGFDEHGRLVKLPPDSAKNAVASLIVDKPLDIPGINSKQGTGSMTDFMRMAQIHQVKFKGHLPPEDVAQFIRNQKYTERLVGDFNELAAKSNPELAKKYKEFIELSAKIRQETTIKGVAAHLEAAYGQKIITNGRVDREGMKKLQELMRLHQTRQLSMMPQLVGAVAAEEAGSMMKWLKSGLGNKVLLRKQLALTYAPYDDKQIRTVMSSIQNSDLDKKDIAWIEGVLDKDRRQMRRYAELLEIGPETLKKRMRITGDNVAIVDFITSKNAKIKSLTKAMQHAPGGAKALAFARSATGRALNMDIILEGSPTQKAILGSMMILSMSRAYGAASREEGLKAVGLALFEMIPIVSGVLRMSEMDYKAAIREFIFDACPPMALAYIGVSILKYVANQGLKVFTDSIWDQLVDEALRQLSDDEFEKTQMGFYRLKNRTEYFEYLMDVSPGFGRVAKLASMIAPEVEALMSRDPQVQQNMAALHTINYLEEFDLRALTRRVRESGIPDKGTALNSERVAAKVILENEKIRQRLHRQVIGDFMQKIEDEYNKRKKDDDEDDFDPTPIVEEARRLLREAYDNAPNEITESEWASEELKNTYKDYIRRLITHPTEDKEELELRRELLEIVDEFRQYIKDLLKGIKLFQEARTLNLVLDVFGGSRSQVATDEVLLGDTFRFGISAMVMPERASMPWTAYYYLVDSSLSSYALIGKQSIASSGFNPGGEGLWPVDSRTKAVQFEVDFKLLEQYFETDGDYYFVAVLGFGAWGGDPIGNVGITALQYPAQHPTSFDKDKLAYMSSAKTLKIKRAMLKIKAIGTVHAGTDKEVGVYLEAPAYALDYFETASFSIFGDAGQGELPIVEPATIPSISFEQDKPTILTLSGNDQVEDGRYILKGESSLKFIRSQGQPFEALRGFDFTKDPAQVAGGDFKIELFRAAEDADGATPVKGLKKGASFFVVAKGSLSKSITKSQVTVTGSLDDGTTLGSEVANPVGGEDPVQIALPITLTDDSAGKTFIANLLFTSLEKIVNGEPSTKADDLKAVTKTLSIKIAKETQDVISTLRVYSKDPKKKKLVESVELALSVDGTLRGIGTHSLSLDWGASNSSMDFDLVDDEGTFSETIDLGKMQHGVYTAKAVLSFEGSQVEKVIQFEVKRDDAFVIKNLRVQGAGGKGVPTTGKGIVATADIVVGDYDGLVGFNWSRASDGESEIVVTDVSPDVEFQAKKEFGPVPKAKQQKQDRVSLEISDGANLSVSKHVNFEWKTGDEFSHFVIRHGATSKMGGRFQRGESILIQSNWEIAKGGGENRSIRYLINGGMVSEAKAVVQDGGQWSDEITYDSKLLAAGAKKLVISAELSNPKTKTVAIGSKTIPLKEGKDELIGVGVSGGQGGRVEQVTHGDTVTLTATVKAVEGLDGERSVSVGSLGRLSSQKTITLQGGETGRVDFDLNTSRLKIPKNKAEKQFSFLFKLFNENGKQDWKYARLLVKKKQQQNTQTGGMQNVYCQSPNVVLKVWDHGSQDGDIISLRLGTDVVLSGFNLNGCGGKEPQGGGCVRPRQLKGGRMAVSVYAHNEGSSSPNTASLKVEGGCTPEKQSWGLKTGETANIWVFYGNQPQ